MGPPPVIPNSWFIVDPDSLPEKPKITEIANKQAKNLRRFYFITGVIHIIVAGLIGYLWIRRWKNVRSFAVVAGPAITGFLMLYHSSKIQVTREDLEPLVGWKRGSGKGSYSLFVWQFIIWLILMALYLGLFYPGLAEFYGDNRFLKEIGFTENNGCENKYCGINPDCPNINNSTSSEFWPNPYEVVEIVDENGVTTLDRPVGACTCYDQKGDQICDGEEAWTPEKWNGPSALYSDVLASHGNRTDTPEDVANIATGTSQMGANRCNLLLCPTREEMTYWTPSRVQMYWVVPFVILPLVYVIEFAILEKILKPSLEERQLAENESGQDDVDAPLIMRHTYVDVSSVTQGGNFFN